MTPQELVQKILFDNDKPKSWLAHKLGIGKSDLGYQLNNAVNYSAELHDRIMEIFRIEGFITNNSEQCAILINQTFQIDSIIGNSLTMLNNAVQQCTEDNVLTFDEKQRLFNLIDEIQIKTNNALDAAKGIIAGKIPLSMTSETGKTHSKRNNG